MDDHDPISELEVSGPRPPLSRMARARRLAVSLATVQLAPQLPVADATEQALAKRLASEAPSG